MNSQRREVYVNSSKSDPAGWPHQPMALNPPIDATMAATAATGKLDAADAAISSTLSAGGGCVPIAWMQSM
jgi:hypothetical protein